MRVLHDLYGQLGSGLGSGSGLGLGLGLGTFFLDDLYCLLEDRNAHITLLKTIEEVGENTWPENRGEILPF